MEKGCCFLLKLILGSFGVFFGFFLVFCVFSRLDFWQDVEAPCTEPDSAELPTRPTGQVRERPNAKLCKKTHRGKERGRGREKVPVPLLLERSGVMEYFH